MNSKWLHDNKRIRLVPVIASFDTDGNIVPLYIRFGEESLKVYNSVMSDSSTYKLFVFHCQVMDGEIVKPVRLTYFLEDNVWAVDL